MERYVKFTLYLIVVILINIVGLSLFVRLDLTQNNIYSLSKISKENVSSLSEPLTIKAFFSKDLPPKYNKAKRYFKDLLQEYSIHANTNFNYQFYELESENKNYKELAQQFGINPLQIQSVQKDELKYINAYLGAVILHGDAMEKLPRLTSTKNLEYKLTSAIETLQNKVSSLLNLKGNIQIKMYLSSSLEQIAPYIGINSLAEFPGKIQNLVQKLNSQYYEKLEYRFIDPSNKESIPAKYQLQELEWPALEEKNIKPGSAKIGLIIEYKDQSKSVSLLNIVRIPVIGTQYSLADLETIQESVQQNIRSLIGINQDLGYLADHGTPSINSYAARGQDKSMTAFQELVSKNYTLKEIKLKEGIPEGLNCLIICGPVNKFTDFELYQIDQALMRGTNLAFFLDSFKPPQQQTRTRTPVYMPNKTGLEKLLSHYGLNLQEAIVLDENCYQQRLSGEQGQGQRPIYFAPIIKNKNINHELEFMKNIKGLITVQASPVNTDNSTVKRLNLTPYQLFSSSRKSWTMTERINFNPMMISPPKSPKQYSKYPLSYMVEGKFQSYFSEKPIPTKKQEQEKNKNKETDSNSQKKLDLDNQIHTQGSKLTQSKPAKIFITGSSQMITDAVLDAQGESPNSVFILNIIDALNNRIAMASLRSKAQEFNPLQETSSLTKSSLKVGNIVGLPLLVIMFGLVVWIHRQRKKTKIQKLFQ